MIGFKLFRKRKDGTLGPLFINAAARIPLMEWLPAEAHRTKGFAFRPGWHCSRLPYAPHLSKRGRVWCEVEMRDVVNLPRPQSQGGLWYLAGAVKVLRELPPADVLALRERYATGSDFA